MQQSNKAMWFANDVLYTARYREFRAKGFSPEDAIKEVERHFVNYKVPDKVLGSKMLSDLVTNRSLSLFGRYHYGRVRAVMNTLKDATSGDPKRMLEASGQMAAYAVLAGVLYPAADEIIGDATGQKNATLRRAGIAGLLNNATLFSEGKKPMTTMSESVVSPSPELTIPAELLSNKNLYSGKPIIGTGNSLSDKGLEIGDYILGKVPLTRQLFDANKQPSMKDAAIDFGLNLLDIQTPPADQKDRQAKGQKYGEQQTRYNDRKLYEKYGIQQ
jgi:hypothetical protein